MTPNTVIWPCLLKLEGDDELIYLHSQSDLQTECQALIWGQEDYVIDSQGQAFGLQHDSASHIRLNPNNKTLSVEEVTKLIQSHEFSLAQRCIIKIQFSSVQQAVCALADS
ncbi:DUF4144 family protein [uncultured Vibrio sp.]|uniref:DUF4144 family protein n=1 Tax=uncultured Vibrio sp. TaxID=114054 RepID=UPI0029C9A05C|nr:DUF4144 family protein [uncultured Vibrio sp.]